MADKFAAAYRQADQGSSLRVEGFSQLGEVVGTGIHLVAIPGLTRSLP
jgi:hypothetical protein